MKKNFGKKGYLVYYLICFVLASAAAKVVLDIGSAMGLTPLSFVFSLLVLVIVACLIVLAGYLIGRKKRSTEEFEKVCSAASKLDMLAVVWEQDLREVYCNEAMTMAVGYTSEDLKKRENILKVFPSSVLDSKTQKDFVSRKDEIFTIHGSNGAGVVTVWTTSRVFTDENGRSYYISVGPNLNRVEKMKDALMEYSEKLEDSEQRYALIMDITEMGVILRYSDNDYYYTNSHIRRMLGFEDEGVFITREQFLEKIHPTDRLMVQQFVLTAAKRQEAGAEDAGGIELRAVSADGDYHWYMMRYRVTSGEKRMIEGGVIIDITNEKQKDLMIEKMAYVDELTQIANRNRFLVLGNELMEIYNADHSYDYWVIILDVDEIHIINDAYGHKVGDDVLKRLALIIMSVMTGGGRCARIGGDDFAMIIRDEGDESLPEKILESIAQKLSALTISGVRLHNITCSAGYCRLSDGDGSDFSQVLELAEFALDQNDGIKNTYTRYDRAQRLSVLDSAQVERELDRALKNSEMVLYYQPKIEFSTGRIIGAEALIRRVKPDGTIVKPADFIPVAERSMIITRISGFVMNEACRQNKEWQDKGLCNITLSINLTAVDFYRTDIIQLLKDTLERTGLEPKYLDVELTESLAFKDIDTAVEQMKDLKELGVKLSIDDFGTGYSSLSYIRELPIDLLKLDRSFICDLEKDEVSRQIVSSVIQIARSKHLKTIAEGVESEGQAEILKKCGCDLAQGYLFGRPMPAKDFEDFVKRNSIRTEAHPDS